MKHLSLFSGIGGLDLAAEWAGFETVAFVERDPYCQRVLAKRWPGVPIIGDVRLVADSAIDGRGAWWPRGSDPGGTRQSEQPLPITIVSGGFPCQPHSVAGKRQASSDDRDLWPEFARVLRAIRPRWVVAENVPGLLNSESGRFFGAVLGDLAELGYSAGWGRWGADDVGARHKRDRIFIVGYAPELGRDGACAAQAGGDREPSRAPRGPGGPVPDTIGEGELQPEGCEPDERGRPGDGGWWGTEPDVGRVAYGVPDAVDRIRALGNAVVPEQAYPLFAEIARIERMKTSHEENSI